MRSAFFFFYFIIRLIQILMVWPRSVVNLCVLLCGGVLLNSTVPIGSWQFWAHFIRTTFHRVAVTGSTERGTETVPDCLACEYSRFSFISRTLNGCFRETFPAAAVLADYELLGGKRNQEEAGFLNRRLAFRSVSVLYFLSFLSIICIYLIFFLCVLLYTRCRTQICPLG